MKNTKLLAGIFLILAVLTFFSCENEPIDKNINLDDFQNCEMPTAFQASNFINDNAISLTWVPGGTETSWTIEYGLVGFTQGTGTIVTTSSTTVIISGLTSSNSYSFYVKANCTENNSSDWVGPVDVPAIQTNPNCPNPTNLTAERGVADPTLVNLLWVAGNTETSWEIQFGVSGFALGTGTIVPSSNTNASIAGISIANNYDFYVRATCSATENSNWVGPISLDGQVSPDCTDPTNLTAVRNTTVTTDVDVAWTAGGTETSWELQYGVKNFHLGTGTIVSSATNTAQVSNIPDVNSYDFYVRANCSSSANSHWVGPMNVINIIAPNTFFAKIDDIDFVESYINVVTVAGTPNSMINIYGVKSSSELVGISIDSTLDIGNYFITGTSADQVKGSYRLNGTNYTANEGNVNIQSKSANRITGVFSFIGSYSYVDANGNTIVVTHAITEGTFDIAY